MKNTLKKTFLLVTALFIAAFAVSTESHAQCTLDRPDLVPDFDFNYNDVSGTVLVVEFEGTPCYLDFVNVPSWLEIVPITNFGGERYRIRPTSVNTTGSPRTASVALYAGSGGVHQVTIQITQDAP
jgi:hypothetical protein